MDQHLKQNTNSQMASLESHISAHLNNKPLNGSHFTCVISPKQLPEKSFDWFEFYMAQFVYSATTDAIKCRAESWKSKIPPTSITYTLMHQILGRESLQWGQIPTAEQAKKVAKNIRQPLFLVCGYPQRDELKMFQPNPYDPSLAHNTTLIAANAGVIAMGGKLPDGNYVVQVDLNRLKNYVQTVN